MKRLIPIAIIIASANAFADESYQHLGCKDESGAYQGLNGSNCENPVIAQEYVLKAFYQNALETYLKQQIDHYNFYQEKIDFCQGKKKSLPDFCSDEQIAFYTKLRNENGLQMQEEEMRKRSDPKYYVNCAVMLKKLGNSHNLLSQELPACYNPNYDFKPLFKVTTQ